MIFEEVPADEMTGGGFDISGICGTVGGADSVPPALFVVGGALMVAELYAGNVGFGGAM